MIIHKLHIQDWKHFLSILSEDLFRISGPDYTYWQTDDIKLKESIKKISEITTYLDKINKHVVEEGTVLTQIKKKIIAVEGKSKFEQQEIERNKSYYEEVYPKFLTTIQTIQTEFINLKNNLEAIRKQLYNKTKNNTAEARELIKEIDFKFITIEGLSTKMANDLKNKYKDIKIEMGFLRDEENMIDHLNHNIESWFLH